MLVEGIALTAVCGRNYFVIIFIKMAVLFLTYKCPKMLELFFDQLLSFTSLSGISSSSTKTSILSLAHHWRPLTSSVLHSGVTLTVLWR